METCRGLASGETIVILVHGTWATNADWCKQDLEFCKLLQAGQDRQLTIKGFQWSGWNTHRARIRAGQELADKIIQASREHPTAKIVLIGHSHGGNVIRYALRYRGAASHVDSVITLATPFIHCEPRSPSAWLFTLAKAFAFEALLISSILAFGLILFLFAELFGSLRLASSVISHFTNLLIIPAIFAVFGALRWLYVNRIGWFLSSVEEKLVSSQIQLLREIDPPLVRNLPLLSVEVRADEARFLSYLREFCRTGCTPSRTASSLTPSRTYRASTSSDAGNRILCRRRVGEICELLNYIHAVTLLSSINGTVHCL